MGILAPSCLSLGLAILGFKAHPPTPFDPVWQAVSSLPRQHQLIKVSHCSDSGCWPDPRFVSHWLSSGVAVLLALTATEHLEFASGHLHCIIAGDKSVVWRHCGLVGISGFTLSYPNVCMRSRLCIKRTSDKNTYNVFGNAMRISSLVGLPFPPFGLRYVSRAGGHKPHWQIVMTSKVRFGVAQFSCKVQNLWWPNQPLGRRT